MGIVEIQDSSATEMQAHPEAKENVGEGEIAEIKPSEVEDTKPDPMHLDDNSEVGTSVENKKEKPKEVKEEITEYEIKGQSVEDLVLENKGCIVALLSANKKLILDYKSIVDAKVSFFICDN